MEENILACSGEEISALFNLEDIMNNNFKTKKTGPGNKK